MSKQINKDVKDLNELELYFLIEECGAFCWRMNHDMADGRIPQSEHAGLDADIVKVKARQIEAINELPKFGIEQPLQEDGRGTEAYWVWYRKWNAWHHNVSDERWQEVNAATRTGITTEQIEEFRKEADAMAKAAAEARVVPKEYS